MKTKDKTKPSKIAFKKIKVIKALDYMPAGNDVARTIINYQGSIIPAFIKVERSKYADFETEIKHLNIITKHGLYNKTPLIYESGMFNDKRYIALEALMGRSLNEILKGKNKNKNDYLFKYGKELALIHQISVTGFDLAFERPINTIPSEENYNLKEPVVKKYLKYLENMPQINHDTFIHGDFHYANILWRNGNISGVIDWEYSGAGFKEQDIAWALILRLGQKFMINVKDMHMFLKGYLTSEDYNEEALRWCLINGYLHFYLMNKNKAYKKRLLKIMDSILVTNPL